MNRTKDIPEYNLRQGILEIRRCIEKFFEDNPDKRMVILVGAGSSTGKTKVVTKRIEEAYPERVIKFSQDDLYKGNAFMESERAKGNILNWDQPEAVDIKLSEELTEALARGMPVPKYQYRFDGNPPAIVGEMKPADIIIVEGLYGLLQNKGDLKIFVHAETFDRMIRRMLRDLDRTEMDSSQIVGYFASVVEPMHIKYIEPTKANADIIINNAYDPEIEAPGTGLSENQLKFRIIGEKGKVLNILTKKRMERKSVATQEDHYFNIRGRDLSRTDEILRIRTESNVCKIFTYKGPEIKEKGRILRRKFKHEFEITPEAEKSLLTLLEGPVVAISKERRMYRWEGLLFAVDFDVILSKNGETRGLGNFIEVMPEDEGEWETIERFLSELGLCVEDGKKTPYSEM
ncbi:MAG: CYTH domain-containing protein [Candidatus Paceibacterota bacterium]